MNSNLNSKPELGGDDLPDIFNSKHELKDVDDNQENLPDIFKDHALQEPEQKAQSITIW